MFLGKSDAFIVNQGGVLYRSDSRPDRVLDALSGVCVRFDAQPKIARLVHRGLQLFGRELNRFWIASMREHGAGRENLDVVGAAMGKQTNFLPYLPRTVRFAVVQIPRQLNVRRETSHRACALADRDVRTGNEHARPNHNPVGDGIAQSDVVESAIHADVAHGGESRKQRHASVWDGRVSGFGRGSLQDMERLGVARVCEMRMTINQPGQYCHFREVDHRRPGGNG